MIAVKPRRHGSPCLADHSCGSRSTSIDRQRVAGQLARTGAPAFVPDASQDPDFGQAPAAIRVSRRLAEE